MRKLSVCIVLAVAACLFCTPGIRAQDIPLGLCPSDATHALAGEPTAYEQWTGRAPLVVVAAHYPSVAIRRCVSGWVAFRFTISSDGRVQDPQVITSYPPKVFTIRGLTALRMWRYPTADPDSPESESGGCLLTPRSASVLSTRPPRGGPTLVVTLRRTHLARARVRARWIRARERCAGAPASPAASARC